MLIFIGLYLFMLIIIKRKSYILNKGPPLLTLRFLRIIRNLNPNPLLFINNSLLPEINLSQSLLNFFILILKILLILSYFQIPLLLYLLELVNDFQIIETCIFNNLLILIQNLCEYQIEIYDIHILLVSFLLKLCDSKKIESFSC